MAKTAVTGFTEAFVHTDPFYRGTYVAKLQRSASGSGAGSEVISRTNLITNPNFETNSTGWGSTGAATISRVTTDAYIGTASVQVTLTNPGNGSGLQNFASGLRIPVSENSTYIISAYVKQTSGTTIGVDIDTFYYDSSNVLISSSDGANTALNGSWQRISRSITTPANTAFMGIDIGVQQAYTGTFVYLVDAVLVETGSTLLPYFDGSTILDYDGRTIQSYGWNGTANASTSTAVFELTNKTTQLRLSQLSDFSFGFTGGGGRFYLGFATIKTTATGSGTGTQTAARTITRQRTASGSGTGTQTASRLISRYRTATGSGTGTQTAARLISRFRTASATGTGTQTADRLISRFRTATGSGTGTQAAASTPTARREATGSGIGTETTVRVIIKLRTASGNGTGTSANTIKLGLLRTGYGSGGATTGDNATPKLTAKRAATNSGNGSASTTILVTRLRTASGSGIGSDSATTIRSVYRTASGSGNGNSSASRILIAIRTATSAGAGTATVIGARVVRLTGSGSGLGTSLSEWVKSHIFRVPTTRTYPFAERLSEEAPDRLFAHTPQGIRAKNLYRLSDGTYTTTDPRRPELITRTYYGGHDIFLTDEEVTELTAAGYGASIT
jgi:hypothetical protein